MKHFLMIFFLEFIHSAVNGREQRKIDKKKQDPNISQFE